MTDFGRRPDLLAGEALVGEGGSDGGGWVNREVEAIPSGRRYREEFTSGGGAPSSTLNRSGGCPLMTGEIGAAPKGGLTAVGIRLISAVATAVGITLTKGVCDPPSDGCVAAAGGISESTQLMPRPLIEDGGVKRGDWSMLDEGRVKACTPSVEPDGATLLTGIAPGGDITGAGVLENAGRLSKAL